MHIRIVSDSRDSQLSEGSQKIEVGIGPLLNYTKN